MKEYDIMFDNEEVKQKKKNKWLQPSKDRYNEMYIGAGYYVSKYPNAKTGKCEYVLKRGVKEDYDYELEQIGTSTSEDSFKILDPKLEPYQIVYFATGGTASGLQRLDPMLFTEEFTEGMIKFATKLATEKREPDEKTINWLVKYIKALSDRYVEYKQLVEQQNRKV